MAIEPGDTVTFHYQAHAPDGVLLDSTRRPRPGEGRLLDPDRSFEPMTVTIGDDELLPGLEDALVGMDAGETDVVTLPPAEAYGEWSADDLHTLSLEEYEARTGNPPPKEGDVLEAQGRLVEVHEVTDDAVTLDFNHQMVGQAITFEIEVLEVD
ncbi:MAG: peptidylprolyl isomerase [Halobacteriales archaeon]